MPSSGRKSLASANASLLRCAPDWFAAGVPTRPAPAGLAGIGHGSGSGCGERPGGGGARPGGGATTVAVPAAARQGASGTRPCQARADRRARLRHDRSARRADSRRQGSSRLAALAHRLRRPRARASARGGPWPLADDFGTEPEASWGPREVLAHTAEMLPTGWASTSGSSRPGTDRRRWRCRSGGRRGHAAARRPRARPDAAAAGAVRPDRRRDRRWERADCRRRAGRRRARAASTSATGRDDRRPAARPVRRHATSRSTSTSSRRSSPAEHGAP